MKNSKLDKFLNSGIENVLYWISIFVIALVAIMYSAHICFVNYTERYELLECSLMSTMGIPCPGCGGTRSIKSLLRGDIISSLYYNAFATYSIIVYAVFFVSHTLEKISGGRIKGIKFRMIYIWIAIVVLVVQYILKLTVPELSI